MAPIFGTLVFAPQAQQLGAIGAVWITGPVGTHFRTARCPRPSKPRVPSTAASGTAQPCRLDGSFVTRRRKGPVKVRGKTRKAFKHSRYMRLPLLVNPRSSASTADKVDQMSGELCLPASAHLIFTSSEHIFELEPSMLPLLTLTFSPPRRI